jgi:hypothetical protein
MIEQHLNLVNIRKEILYPEIQGVTRRLASTTMRERKHNSRSLRSKGNYVKQLWIKILV